MLTFEQVTSMVDVYSGTEVDSATKLVLADWLFDRYISAADDSMSSVNTWARWYKRYVNMNYPIYLDLLKMDLARSSMDPFITELIERLTSGDSSVLTSGSGLKVVDMSKDSQGMRTDAQHGDGSTEQTRTPDLTSTDMSQRTDSEHNTGDSTDVRTPELTTSDTSTKTGVDSDIHDGTEVRTPDLTKTDEFTGSEQQTTSEAEHSDLEGQDVRTPELMTDVAGNNLRSDDLQSGSTSYHDDGMNKNGSVDSYLQTTTNIKANDSGQTRAMNITYPEANMNAIPTDIENFPTNIDYAEGEADTFSKGQHTENNGNKETHNLHYMDETVGTNTGDVTTMDANSTLVHGEETTDKTASEDKMKTGGSATDRQEDKTSTETGTDTKESDGSAQKSTSEMADSTRTESGTDTTTSENEGDVVRSGADMSTKTETGTETTTGSTGDDRISSSADSQSETGETNEQATDTRSTASTNDGSENVQGRHESIADILPRACSAIKSTNALKWFVNVLQPCFDNYAEM